MSEPIHINKQGVATNLPHQPGQTTNTTWKLRERTDGTWEASLHDGDDYGKRTATGYGADPVTAMVNARVAHLIILMEQVERERDEARAIIDKLPKDRNGTPVMPGTDYVIAPNGLKALVDWDHSAGQVATIVPERSGIEATSYRIGDCRLTLASE